MSAKTLYTIDKLIHELNEQSNDEKIKNIDNKQDEDYDTENKDKEEEFDDDVDDITIDSIKSRIRQFAIERDWEQYHTPRNLLLALVGEVGELSEIFQWKSDKQCQIGLPKWTKSDRIHLGEEMADILIYLSRLADVCNVNLTKAVIDKMSKNAKKYPSDLVRGSSKKYTEY